MISTNLIKEVCDCCRKFINIGQPITECQKCNSVIHTKCYTKSDFIAVNNLQYCQSCCFDIPEKYNPFISQLTSHNNDTDHHYDEDIVDTLDILAIASHTLNNCTSHTRNNLAQILNSDETINFSTFFLNIDGNKTNFDSLAAELSTLSHEFSIIGLAETNIYPLLKNMYPISNYNIKLQ